MGGVTLVGVQYYFDDKEITPGRETQVGNDRV